MLLIDSVVRSSRGGIAMQKPTTGALRAAAGARFLDTVQLGWEREIDLGTLCMENPCCCLLAQLSGSFTNGSRAFELTGYEARAFGFNIDAALDAPNIWQELDWAWQFEVADRLVGGGSEPLEEMEPEAVEVEPEPLVRA